MSQWPHIALALSVLVIGTAISVGLFRADRQAQADLEIEIFERQSALISAEFSTRLERINALVVASWLILDRHARVGETITAETWAATTNRFIDAFPDVSRFALQDNVTHARRESWLAEVSAEYGYPVVIYNLTNPSIGLTNYNQSAYWPVRYPTLSHGSLAPGGDLFTRADRREAVFAAVAAETPIATGVVELVEGLSTIAIMGALDGGRRGTMNWFFDRSAFETESDTIVYDIFFSPLGTTEMEMVTTNRDALGDAVGRTITQTISKLNSNWTIRLIASEKFEESVSSNSHLVVFFVLLCSSVVFSALIMMLACQDYTANQRRRRFEAREHELQASAYRAALQRTGHELKNPLHGLRGVLQSVFAKADEERQCQDLRAAIGATDLMVRVLDDMSIVQVSRGGKMSINKIDISPACLMRDLARQCAGFIQRKLVFQYAIGPNLPETVIADGVRLKQIIGNAIDNGGRYTQNGLVRLGVWRSHNYLVFVVDSSSNLKCTEDEAFDHIQRKDDPVVRQFLKTLPTDITGTYPGISTWVTVSRATDHSTDVGHAVRGLGVGLPLTARICAVLGLVAGLDRISSHLTRFYVALPIDGTESKQNPPDEASQTLTFQPETPIYAVVDDDKLALRATLDYFDALGLKTQAFTSQAEFGQVENASKFSAIFLDIILLDGDGRDICRHLKSTLTNCPRIIAMTGLDDISDMKSVGFDGILRKAFSDSQITYVLAVENPREFKDSRDLGKTQLGPLSEEI